MDPTKKRRLLTGAALAAVLALGFASTQVCLSAWLSYDLVTKQCPDGKPRQTLSLSAQELHRGKAGTVTVGALAHFAAGSSDHLQVPIRKLRADLFLIDGTGKETALEPERGWTVQEDHSTEAKIALPEVPDGDYRLRARVKTGVGTDTVDIPVPLYSPARVHVLTDRPLYEPGHTVQFRAVALAAKDLAPLDGRPGAWEVYAPSGELLLDERAPAGDWGVVAGSFPLDRGAETGEWRVRWSSGGAFDEARFRVEPFTLPRFRLEVSTRRPFYRPGERPLLKGAVVYSSGAPVAGANLGLSWSASGDWPPPTEWMSTALPQHATTGPDGRFSLELPRIPDDLRQRATLVARISATDRAGDRVEETASVLLAEDAVSVSAVTELGEGLVEGFNNRLYLRMTTADGRPLPHARVRLRRAWDPRDPGLEAECDEDGVASLQVDPGPAVNVVVPPLPVRLPPKEPAVSRGEVMDLLGGEEAPLADQMEMDRWLAALEPCARYVRSGGDGDDGGDEGQGGDDGELQVGLAASAEGAVTATASTGTPLARCAVEVLRARRLPPGRERLYSLAFSFSDHALPKLHVEMEGVPDVPEPVGEAIRRAVLGARECLADDALEADLPRALLWRTSPRGKEISVSWIADPRRSVTSHPAAPCIQGRLARISLDKEAEIEALGLARLHVEPAPRMTEARPQPTTFLGYEFLVTASDGGKEVGSTRLRMTPGVVPPVRLRATPVLARAGEPVEVEILRGPDLDAELPEKLELEMGERRLEAKVDPKKRSARFELPADAEGWLQVRWLSARASIYVRPKAELSVSVEPERPRYAPGQLARLLLRTEVKGAGTKAAVGLFGVDESLGQLASLPGADELARLRPSVSMSSPAFGVLDGQALAMGRIRGANAAAATVLRVTELPAGPEQVAGVSTQGSSSFDPVEDLTDHFYSVLGELHVQARDWEEKAPPDEQMSPRLLASLWERALDACEEKKTPTTDAYGRRLRLSLLPQDLLALTDPRQVVLNKTRLPEDVESWTAWVAKEQP